MGGNTRSAVDQQRALLPLIYGGGGGSIQGGGWTEVMLADCTVQRSI